MQFGAHLDLELTQLCLDILNSYSQAIHSGIRMKHPLLRPLLLRASTFFLTAAMKANQFGHDTVTLPNFKSREKKIRKAQRKHPFEANIYKQAVYFNVHPGRKLKFVLKFRKQRNKNALLGLMDSSAQTKAFSSYFHQTSFPFKVSL